MENEDKITPLDCLKGTIVVFALLYFFNFLFSFEIFYPLKSAFSDFELSDLNYSDLKIAEKEAADPNIILVNVRDMSHIDLAKVIMRLNQQNPKVVGIDIVLDKKQIENDSILELYKYVFANTKNLVLNNILQYNKETKNIERIIEPIEELKNFGVVGFSNIMLEKDKSFETTRKYSPKLSGKDSMYYSFAYRIVQLYKPGAIEKLDKRANKTEIINFKGNYSHFSYIDGNEILADNYSDNFFKDHIVLISKYDPFKNNQFLADMYFTPLDTNQGKKSLPDMHRIVVQANIISMITHENYFNSLPFFVTLIFTFVLSYCNMLLFAYFELKVKEWYELLSLIAFFFESVVLIFVSYISFNYFRMDMNLNITLLALIVTTPIFEAYAKSIKPLTIKFFNKHKEVSHEKV